MEEKNGSSLSLILSGIVVLTAVVGGAAWRGQALKSPRPESEWSAQPGTRPAQPVEARMWQDPWAAIHKWAASGSGDKSRQGIPPAELIRDIKRSAVREEDSVNPGVEIIFCMLPGALYTEETEARLRARHAVVSALSTAGYRAEDEEHLGILALPWPHQPPAVSPRAPAPSLAGGLPKDTFREVQLPYEWFRKRLFDRARSDGYDRVLLVWLPDTLLADAPLPRLAQLVETFRLRGSGLVGDPSELAVRVKILGPQGSSMLREMLPWKNDPAVKRLGEKTVVEENIAAAGASPHLGSLQDVTMYSWSATAMDDLLVHGMFPKYMGYGSREGIGRYLREIWGLSFINVVATDEMLMQEMLDELQLRDVDLRKRSEHVALISEWDTFYGRNIPVAFAIALAQRRHEANLAPDLAKLLKEQKPLWHTYPLATRLVELFRYAKPPEEPWPGLPLNPNVHPFSYLRGVDGKLPGDKREVKDLQRRPSGQSELETLIRLNDREMNKPEGQNQLDYIPRIGDQLERLQAELRKQRQALRAIGVLGSDFYDKLLILQALRDRFPGLIFFTTDLDARFLQPEFLKHTRNLVVTSSFGLALHPKHQDDVPPFRNSYQTSLYFAALRALALKDLDAQEDSIKTPVPRRFEIGRFHAVDLSVTKDSKPPIHPQVVRWAPSPLGVFLILVAAMSGVWLLMRLVPVLRALLMPSERCRLLSQAALVRASDLIDPVETINRWAEFGPKAEAARLRKNDFAVMPPERSKADRETLLGFLNAQITRFRLPGTWAWPASRHGPRLAHRIIGLWHRRKIWRWRSRLAMRHRVDRYLPGIVRSARPRIDLLQGELRGSYYGAVGGGLAVLVFVCFVTASHTQAVGEPVSLWEGISIWPAECLRLLSLGLSIFFIGRVLHNLARDQQEICVDFGLKRRVAEAPPKFAGKVSEYVRALWRWRGEHTIYGWAPEMINGSLSAEKLWAEYQVRGQQALRFLRPMAPIAVYLTFGLCLVGLSEHAFVPARGAIAFALDRIVLLFSVLAFLFLTFLVVDATRLCRVLVLHLIEETQWPEETKRRFSPRNGCLRDEDLDPWIDIQLIARTTTVVSKLVWYPFIVLSLLILARTRYFDAWNWPVFLVVIFIINAIWAFSSALLLGMTARQARASTSKSFRKAIDSAPQNTPQEKERVEQLEKMLKEVENIREGAFEDVKSNPAIKAVLLPFTGGGIALLLEFLTAR